MKKVFIVTECGYKYIIGVFSKEKLAKDFIDKKVPKNSDNYTPIISSYIIDECIKKKYWYEVSMSMLGKVTNIGVHGEYKPGEGFAFVSKSDLDECKGILTFYKEDRVDFIIDAIDVKSAIEIAEKRRIEIIANNLWGDNKRTIRHLSKQKEIDRFEND